ncbi:MAG: hypothetical protein J0H82_10500 [Alphaproteobacteria bacterium]|jgi:hypothetical protein|nr:hypothetical protein [Alphaproteobacteria bacterium]
MGNVDDAYTGNDDVGGAQQSGIGEFWAIATAQTKFWKAPRTTTAFYAAATQLIQAGVSTTGYIENTSVTVGLSGIQCKLKTPEVVTFDLIPGSAVTLNHGAKWQMTANKAFLVGTHVQANSALKVKELISQCHAAMSKAKDTVTAIDDGSVSAVIGEALRA